MSPDLLVSLQKYAEVIVHVGLNLQPGQRLLMSAPLAGAPIARSVAEQAYKAGARLVSVLWQDEQLTLIRFKHAPRDSFEEFPAWTAQARVDAARSGDASLSIHAEDPNLLAGQDPELISKVDRTASRHFRPFMDEITRNAMNWSVVSVPVESWWRAVFPGLDDQTAENKLWEAILKACRILEADPVAAWKAHVQELGKRRDYLLAKQYETLQFRSPGTDLTIGLVPNHVWLAGELTDRRGITFVPNLPTEEVFSLPHRERVEGVVRSTRPLSEAGTLIEDFTLTFEHGRVVNLAARRGEQVLRRLIDTDDGAGRLGEVALVPASAPTARLDLLFLNTLFDENAASHLALGEAYKFSLKDGETLSPEAFQAAGGNDSLIHVDFMIGSPETEIDGMCVDGTLEPVMRRGEWAFDV